MGEWRASDDRELREVMRERAVDVVSHRPFEQTAQTPEHATRALEGFFQAPLAPSPSVMMFYQVSFVPKFQSCNTVTRAYVSFSSRSAVAITTPSPDVPEPPNAVYVYEGARRGAGTCSQDRSYDTSKVAEFDEPRKDLHLSRGHEKTKKHGGGPQRNK